MSKIDPNIVRLAELKYVCRRLIFRAFDVDEEATFPADGRTVIHVDTVETNFPKGVGEGQIVVKFRVEIEEERENEEDEEL